MGFLGRLFGLEKEPWIPGAKAEAFLIANGVDPDTAGFPSWNNRTREPLEAYGIWFRNLRAYPVQTAGNDIEVEVAGDYMTQAVASYRAPSGDWRPGGLVEYNFKARRGQLDIERAE